MLRSLPVRNLSLYKKINYNRSGALGITLTVFPSFPHTVEPLGQHSFSLHPSFLEPGGSHSARRYSVCVGVHACLRGKKGWAACFPARPLESCMGPCLFSIINLQWF